MINLKRTGPLSMNTGTIWTPPPVACNTAVYPITVVYRYPCDKAARADWSLSLELSQKGRPLRSQVTEQWPPNPDQGGRVPGWSGAGAAAGVVRGPGRVS